MVDTKTEEAEEVILEEADAASLEEPIKSKLNLIRLMMEDNKAAFLITDLEPENAIETFEGNVMTPFGETKGRLCPVVLKKRGEWLNYDGTDGNKSADIFILLSNPYLARTDTRADILDANTSNTEILTTMMAYDKSEALEYRDKWLLERKMRLQGEEAFANLRFNVYQIGSQIGAGVVDDTDLAIEDLSKQLDKRAFGFNFNSIKRWAMENKFLAALIVFGGLFFLYTFFTGGFG